MRKIYSFVLLAFNATWKSLANSSQVLQSFLNALAVIVDKKTSAYA